MYVEYFWSCSNGYIGQNVCSIRCNHLVSTATPGNESRYTPPTDDLTMTFFHSTRARTHVCVHNNMSTYRVGHFVPRAYDPADYSHLNVSAEIKDLFQYIGRYKAHAVDLDTTLRCFVPDFIPAVGDMDAFLKVPRPDNNTDELGSKASRTCPLQKESLFSVNSRQSSMQR